MQIRKGNIDAKRNGTLATLRNLHNSSAKRLAAAPFKSSE
jgi:hypothetical protein